jgi:two-component sensor histidine kinase
MVKGTTIELGGSPAMLYFISDITDRKRAEEMVRKSLAEKEILLKEIHHRVKNNMQVISSLLSLQAGAIRDPAVEEAFKVSQNRVKSMALIHEHLYQSENLSEIDFRQYAISLVRNIMNMYSSNRIDTRVNVDGLKLDIDRAIPCGLIINELVSNCVKHAFPDRRRGRIDVNMKELACGGYELVVADDGVGCVEETWKCETLGMRLIRSLITQLRGSIQVESSAGTRVTIRF